MAIWYVRPDDSHGGDEDGESYANAWHGWSEITWGSGGVSLGDTLYICGEFSSSVMLALGVHGANNESEQVTLRGDYPDDPGSFVFSGSGYLNSTRNYTTFRRLKIKGMVGFSCILHVADAGGIIEECELIGATNGVGLGSNISYTSCIIRNNIIHGQSNIGINHSINAASITATDILISGNTIYEAAVYGIQAAIFGTHWTSSRFERYVIRNNIVRDCPGASIYFRSCDFDLETAPTIYSNNIEVSNNTVDRCGTIAGDNGKHGGITVMGATYPVIFGNTVCDTYVTGAGIQTAKNLDPQIINNRISGIRSGTPTEGFQNGAPVDGNGIFFDIFTVGGLASGNHISNLVRTRSGTSSGVGLAFWRATNAQYIGNIVENCYRGASFGQGSETGNIVANNTFINCDAGVFQVGTAALGMSVKNNIMLRCTRGFLTENAGAIQGDYNCIYGSVTAYAGTGVDNAGAISPGSNDLSLDPELDHRYAPQNASVRHAGTYFWGKDFYGEPFTEPQNIGAVAE